MLTCLDIRDGGVRFPSNIVDGNDVAANCWWGKELSHDHPDRRGIVAGFLETVAAQDRTLAGSVVIELHDGSTSEPGFSKALLEGYGIPTLAGNCGTGYSPNASETPPLATGSCDAQFGIVDAHFIQSRGYSESGGLRAQVRQASAAHPWEKKTKAVVWRGGSTGRQFPGYPFPDPRFNQRVALAQLGRRHLDQVAAAAAAAAAAVAGNPLASPAEAAGTSGGGDAATTTAAAAPVGAPQAGSGVAVLDALLSNTVQMREEDARALHAARLVGGSMGPSDMIKARGVLDVDGNANSWDGLFWKLLSNSVVLKVQSNYSQWYYPRLVPWKHFVPVRPDLSDLMEKVEWVVDPANDDKIRRIASASTDLVKPMTFKAEVKRTAALLKRAFDTPHRIRRRREQQQQHGRAPSLATHGAKGEGAEPRNTSSAGSFHDMVILESQKRLVAAVEAFALRNKE